MTQKLNLTITPSSNVVTAITACDTYTWANNGVTYTSSGTYTGTTANCVTQKLNLTITPSSDNVTAITACDSYTWAANGQTYTASGTYTNVTTNAAGCPDTATLVLTINNSTSSTMTETACDSYVLPALNANNTYHTATNGGGTMYAAGTAIATSQTIYIWAQTGTTPNCTDESSFVVTINTTPDILPIADVTACDSYALPALSIAAKFTAPPSCCNVTLEVPTGNIIVSSKFISFPFAVTGITGCPKPTLRAVQRQRYASVSP